MISYQASAPDLYLLAFAASAVGLLAWNAFEQKKLVRDLAPLLLACGLVGMAASMASIQGDVSDRLFLFARDLLVQATIAFAVRQLIKRPALLFSLLVLVATAYTLYYKPIQENDLQQVLFDVQQKYPSISVKTSAPADATDRLDPNAELLTDLQSAQKLASAFPDIVTFESAFSLAAPTSEQAKALSEIVAVNVLSDSPEDVLRLSDFLQREGWVEENEKLLVEPLAPQKSGIQRLSGPLPSEVGLNDPEVVQQWALRAWPYEAFAKTSAKLLTRFKPSTLFVLDSGVDGTHPDLTKNFLSYGVEHDRDGIGHGTHVAGIAAAVANNGLGIAGWFPAGDHEVKVSSIRVIGSLGYATQQAVVQGIIDASDAGATVINLSLGARSNDQRQKVYEQAVAYANAKGCIVVAAAGNSASDAQYYSPANTPGIIAVAALDNELSQASFSNSITNIAYGVWAPGKDIYSTVPNGGYTMFSGTSMAAPQVAGLLTVAKAINPSLTTREAFQLLRSSTQLNAQQGGQEVEVINPGDFLEAVSRG